MMLIEDIVPLLRTFINPQSENVPPGHVRTAKAKVRLRACADWTGPKLSTESLDIVEYFNGKEMPGWDFAHVRNDVTTHIFLMFEGIFLLDATKFFFPVGIFIPFGISEGRGGGGEGGGRGNKSLKVYQFTLNPPQMVIVEKCSNIVLVTLPYYNDT